MKEIGTRNSTRTLIDKYNIKIKKRFGQNFLTDINILKKIVKQANIDNDTLVVEIGPGIGALTEQLLNNAGHVLAYEIDNDLIPILENNFKNLDFTLINSDVLLRDVDEDIKALNKHYKKTILVANLPYYITTPIIMKFLEESSLISEYYVMMQLEVAKRFTSVPQTKDYNSLSVFIQYKTEASILMKVPKTVFVPEPNVDSAIVKLIVKDKKDSTPVNESYFYKLVRGSFVMRRKTLVNNLATSLGIDKQKIKDVLQKLNYKESIRAEELEVKDFIALSDYFYLSNIHKN
jgi:16S rRNA (adenine1518-N6/adenine1519-N6)-dimethyltransferase